MRCRFPRLVSDGSPGGLYVPCGRCMECRINKTTDWATRIWCELPYYDKASFITLTFDDAYMDDPSVCKRDLQLFFKRVRKMFPIDLKQFSCGEYGSTTFRKHYHAIVLGVDFKPWVLVGYNEKHNPIYNSDSLSKLWPFGFATVDEVTDADIKYVTGYIRKKLSGPAADVYRDLGVQPPFQLQSKGIGLRYALDNQSYLDRNLFIVVNGQKRPVPKYMARKIGLCDPIPDVGFSPLYLKAKEIVQKRSEQFEKSVYKDMYKYDFLYFNDVRRQAAVDHDAYMDLNDSRNVL